MANVYRLSREGGAQSPRFTTYVALAGTTHGLSGYNPMAGSHALDTVVGLIEMNAESLADSAAESARRTCNFDEDLTLAIVVASAGMWTDRLATEIDHHTSRKRASLKGTILLWTREQITPVDVQRESAAEAIRTMWTSLHGQVTTLGAMLAREGLAYAPALNRYASPPQVCDVGFSDAIGVLGETTDHGDIVAAMYGDTAAETLGWVPLGLAPRAGFQWAAAFAEGAILERGAREALRSLSTAMR